MDNGGVAQAWHEIAIYATFKHAIQFWVALKFRAWKFNQYLMCDRRCLQQTPSSLTNEYVALLFENEHTITTYGERTIGNGTKADFQNSMH